MIFITGDTHGNVDYRKLLSLKDLRLSYNDYLLICGDAGICWSFQTFNYFLSLYNNIGCTIIFIDGNHENFEMINHFPIVEFHNALMHQIDKNIFHVLRGEIIEIDNLSFLCIGGAVSIDKQFRTPYISWWPEEEITCHDIDNALNNLARFKNKVDFVITHCCDTRTLIREFGFKKDSCTDQLSFIDKSVEYSHWFFGHYHFDRRLNNKKTCLYEKIIQIK